jgi:hypothetical protein
MMDRSCIFRGSCMKTRNVCRPFASRRKTFFLFQRESVPWAEVGKLSKFGSDASIRAECVVPLILMMFWAHDVKCIHLELYSPNATTTWYMRWSLNRIFSPKPNLSFQLLLLLLLLLRFFPQERTLSLVTRRAHPKVIFDRMTAIATTFACLL